jgi:hypothetical protein
VEVQERFEGESFSVVGVTHASEEEARAFLEEHEPNYPVALVGEEDFAAFGVELVWGSTFYLVSPEGLLVAEGLGDCEARLEEELP